MALSVNNYTQQAFVSPFSQRGEETRSAEERKPQENRPQPREAASAGVQNTETRNERRAESSRSDDRADESRDTRRGSTVDITV